MITQNELMKYDVKPKTAQYAKNIPVANIIGDNFSNLNI